MKQKKHFVDIWCEEQFLKFPFAVKEAKEFISKKKGFGDSWPDWCGLPMSATYAIITRYADIPTAKKLHVQLGPTALPDLTAALLWSKSKFVYRFDPEFYSELGKETKIEKIPVEVLHQLPFHCVFIEAPIELVETTAKGFFAWLEYDVNSKTSELRLLYLSGGGHTTSYPIILTGGDIDDSNEALFESASRNIASSEELKKLVVDAVGIGNADGSGIADAESLLNHDEIDEKVRECVLSALNAVLYLCSLNATVEYKSFARAVSVSSSTDKHGHPKKHRYWDVGVRFGKAFRAYKEKQSGAGRAEKNEAQDRFLPRPHLRRAHWHHYWTGKRGGDDRKLILRWVHPVFVGEGESGLPTTVHKIDGAD